MNIDTMSDRDLEQLYHNCMTVLLDQKPNAAKAEAMLSDINRVWEARLRLQQAGEHGAESPDVGVLRRIGYRVGKDAVPATRRHALLGHVMFRSIPFVGSLTYMAQWGEPGTEVRYRKLHRVLAGFRTAAQSRDDRAKALKDWNQDLGHIEQIWKGRL